MTRLRVGEPIPAFLRPGELRQLLGYSNSRFCELQKAGRFDGLWIEELQRYSGAKLEQLRSAEAAEPSAAARSYFTRAHRPRTSRQPRPTPTHAER